MPCPIRTAPRLVITVKSTPFVGPRVSSIHPRAGIIGQDIQRGKRLCEGHGAAQRDIRDGCRQLHRAGSFDDGSQSRRAVKPRRLKHEVVVGGSRSEAALTRGVDCGAQTRERLPFIAELDQREMKAEFQTGPIPFTHSPPDMTSRGHYAASCGVQPQTPWVACSS